MSWPTVNLIDAYWFQEGPGIRNWQFTTNGIKLLNVGNIEKSGRINLAKTDRHISLEEAQGKYKHFLCDEGDLVIASSGISIDEDGYLRTRGAFLEKHHLPLCVNTSTIRFKSLKDNELSYLKHWLDSVQFRKQITKLVTGSAQLNFGPSHLKQLKISLPPLSEQKRIAAVLDKAAEIKAKREQAIAKLDELAQSTFVEMFGNTITNEKRWTEITLADIASEKPNNGIFRKNNEYGSGFPVAWVEELFKGDFLELGNTRRVEATQTELKKYGLSYGDLLFCRSSLKLDGIGFNNVYLGDDSEALFECHLIRIKPNLNMINPIFANFMLRTPASRENLKKNSKTVTMTTIDQDGLLRTKIFLPPMSLQQKFADVLNKIVIQKSILKRLKNVDSSLYNSLQHQAFTAGFDA